MLTNSVDNTQCKAVDFISRSYALKARLDDLEVYARLVLETKVIKLANGANLRLDCKKDAALTGDVLHEPFSRDLRKLAKAVRVVAEQASIFLRDTDVAAGTAALNNILDLVTHDPKQQAPPTPAPKVVEKGWGAPKSPPPPEPKQQAQPVFTPTKPVAKPETPKFEVEASGPQKTGYGCVTGWASKPPVSPAAPGKFKVKSGLP